MSQRDKLLARLRTRPKDFEYDEAKRLLKSYGFQESNKGKTSGSCVAFIRPTDKLSFILHKPHPQGILKMYAVDELLKFINILSNEEVEENE